MLRCRCSSESRTFGYCGTILLVLVCATHCTTLSVGAVVDVRSQQQWCAALHIDTWRKNVVERKVRGISGK
jgi:hypothetical protein